MVDVQGLTSVRRPCTTALSSSMTFARATDGQERMEQQNAPFAICQRRQKTWVIGFSKYSKTLNNISNVVIFAQVCLAPSQIQCIDWMSEI